VALTSKAAGAATPQDAFDPTPYVNPELRPFFGYVRKLLGDAELNLDTLAAHRQRAFGRPPLPTPSWMERTIAGCAGAPDVRLYIVNAGGPETAPRPAILHIHGGGFVMGDAKSALHDLQEIASALDCVIVTVDYRLAPETPFPGSLEDNYAGLAWLHRNAVELGVDRARIAVMGESSGGGHAAMLAIAARDRGEVPLAYQALISPMLDDRTGSTRTKPAHIGMAVWNEQMNRFGWTSLLGVPAGSGRAPLGAVPARVEDLRGLPPTFIGVGSIDLFIDEDLNYARRLIDAGVSVELNVVPGAFHGFEAAPNFKIVRRFRAAVISALASALERDDGA
jgi:acetyl esterase/lipase